LQVITRLAVKEIDAMLPAVQSLIAELDRETPATRRVLERVPEDRFDWRPHPKSMSAAQLAQHVASIPATIAGFAALDGLDMAARRAEYPPCESRAALLATLDASVAAARESLTALDEARAGALWRMTFGERELFAAPRLEIFRTMLLNHWYHHRGELVVYLRLLDVPVPVVYGRSADEGPFNRPA
jgi:uncharacterized damage-inducible protein DinB